jgi:hypothetical protein
MDKKKIIKQIKFYKIEICKNKIEEYKIQIFITILFVQIKIKLE